MTVQTIMLLAEKLADDARHFAELASAVAATNYDGRIDPDDEGPNWHAIVASLGDPDSFASAKGLSAATDWDQWWTERTNSPKYRSVQTALIRDIFGNPFRPVVFAPEWRTEAAVGIAAKMYDSRDFGNMPVLADALQDAGCELPDVLDHCRVPANHVRGCWVVDLVLGKS